MLTSQGKITYLRNFIFGVEDSLVSTVGLLSGIAIASVPRETIYLTGVVLIFVEAFSMSAGSFLSEYSAEEYEAHREIPTHRSFVGALIMFVSYFVSGFVALAPYFFFEVGTAFGISVLASLLALFLLGVIGGKVTRTSVLKNATRMVVIGGVAILVGIVVGKYVA